MREGPVPAKEGAALCMDAREAERVEERGENMPLRSLGWLYMAVEDSVPYPLELPGVRSAGGGGGAGGRVEAALTDCIISIKIHKLN